MAEEQVKVPGPDDARAGDAEDPEDAGDPATGSGAPGGGGDRDASESSHIGGSAGAPRRRRISDSGALVVATALLASGAIVALATPRPVAPSETPGLALPPGAAEEARDRDRQLAAEAPTGIPAETVLDAYRRHGLAEKNGTNPETYRYDRRSIVRATALLREESGEEALGALRARVTEHLDEGLRGTLDSEDQDALMGTFIETMSGYGIVRDGEWRAPDLVVRTLFKARFNATLRLPLTEGLSPIELEAYWGWLAFEAHDAPTDRRLVALRGYEEVTGTTQLETRGTLLFDAEEFLAAAEAFEDAYRETGNLRLRNHALAAMAEANP